MKNVKRFEDFIFETELNEMKFTSAGARELLTAIYYNWEKLKKDLKAEQFFNSFKDVMDYLKNGDQEEQDELEKFVKDHGVQILPLNF
jgi:hypothetical protein